ncbi:acyltransferase family protein [Parvularcula sp. LCG005]|uniref:acyltransferase family protein n=1 Tax=Parvularcula sp. LCG005 TaxID=3078805 RepID=UPI002941D370|nr:acyltransferase family protein [Parvularcula sp. LCG005]WOI53826.1 acyltransferase family protein [Parvularcula sp. LCG005]
MTATTTERLHSLDFVRGSALLLGIVFHAGLSFYPSEIPTWIVMDAQRSEPIAWLGFVLHTFRMATFFLLAGYFGRMVYHRKGAGYFIRSRLKRIAAPLAIFLPLNLVAITVLLIWAMMRQYGLTMEQMPPSPPPTLETFPWTHLWFLYVLILAYIAMLVLRLPIAMLDRGGKVRAGVDGLLNTLTTSSLSPLLLALPVAIALYNQPGWNEWMGVPTPDTGVVPNTPAMVTYGLAFWLGWQLQRGTNALLPFKRFWPLFLVSGAGAIGICLYLVDGQPGAMPTLEGREKMIFAASYALAIWYLTFAFIGMAIAFFNGENRVTRYIADSSYWLYIIHLPIVLAMQIWIFDWNWSAEAKYAFILGTSVPAMLLSYHLLVRYSFIGNLLNGPRKRKA